jgi:hypothetical protein
MISSGGLPIKAANHDNKTLPFLVMKRRVYF